MTNLTTGFHRAEPEAEHASLGDLIRAVEALRARALAATDVEFHHLAMRVVNAAEDVQHMEGVVLDGEVYDGRRLPEQFTVCFCSNNRHSDAQHDVWGMHASEAAAEREAFANGGHLIARELVAITRVVKTR